MSRSNSVLVSFSFSPLCFVAQGRQVWQSGRERRDNPSGWLLCWIIYVSLLFLLLQETSTHLIDRRWSIFVVGLIPCCAKSSGSTCCLCFGSAAQCRRFSFPSMIFHTVFRHFRVTRCTHERASVSLMLILYDGNLISTWPLHSVFTDKIRFYAFAAYRHCLVLSVCGLHCLVLSVCGLQTVWCYLSAVYRHCLMLSVCGLRTLSRVICLRFTDIVSWYLSARWWAINIIGKR